GLPSQQSGNQPRNSLLIWENDQNAILGAYTIDFERFKLCWIQVIEIYALVHVSSTFEHFEF
ncbi:hypothetical protein, partial [Actinobacillus pleuropneumoniae]|uniref:hypothetical protein n=1 Tax=Actinobacillus pleuropneumoniae TaxID=715 RepID=UPI00227AD10C